MDLTKTQRLITGAQAGGDVELGELLEHLRPRLRLWVASRMSPQLKAKVDAEDLTQETLAAVHAAFGSFEGGETRSFMAWLFRIAENRIRDAVSNINAIKRQPVLRMTFSQTSPSGALVRSEQSAVVMDALGELPEPHREVIRLRRLEERTVGEIAELMDRSENAVRILYCRALKALRAALQETETSS